MSLWPPLIFTEEINFLFSSGWRFFFHKLLPLNRTRIGFREKADVFSFFSCGFFFLRGSSSTAARTSLRELGRWGKTSCFILAALLLKDLERSLSHLLARSPSSCLLPRLPFSSPRALSNPSLGRNRRCVALWWDVCGVGTCVSVRVCLFKCTPVHSVVCMRLHVTQCVFCLNPPSAEPYKAPCV